MELLLTLDRSSAARARTPLHAQLEQQLREGIRSGRLAAGTRLPATRELARELGISRGVAVEAYAQLTAEGYLTTRRGAGTVVAEMARRAAPPRPSSLAPRVTPQDFHPGMPDIAAFPRAAWGRALRNVARTAPDAAYAYPDPAGVPELRTALARYLGRSRGVAGGADAILVTSGLTQGIALLCRALHRRGVRRLAVEDPGFMVHRAVVLHHGLEIVPIPVDEDGLSVDALDASDARAVLVTPAHQSPTGVVLAPERRAALSAWAERRDAYVIEDDYDAEYRYDRDPVGALQGLAPERVAYAGCASKVLAPGLRLGWLVLPAALVDPVAAEKAFDDLGTPVLDQLALADFLERGELDRHLRRMRPRYRARRDALVTALARELPDWRVGGIAAGLHLLARLPDEVDERGLLAAARERGLTLHGLGWFRVTPGPPGIALGYGSLTPAAIEHGVGELAAAYAPFAPAATPAAPAAAASPAAAPAPTAAPPDQSLAPSAVAR